MLGDAGSWPDEAGDSDSYLEEERRQPGAGTAQGLAWSWEIDLEQLLAAVTGQEVLETAATSREAQDSSTDPQLGDTGTREDDQEDQEASLDAELDALDACESRPLSPAEMAGLVAGPMPPGPGLAALLAAASPTDLADYALPDVAAAYRRICSWAQASELACVAQIAARAAARDPKIGIGTDGRPAQVTREASAEVSLALTMTGACAEWWTDLAVTLSWQLRATGEALRDGMIDLARARLIAEATCLLDDETARAVEEKILPDAGEKTTGALRAALRRAVIAADPAGAERRREEAERRARVVLHPEAESTATLAGQGLPGVHAVAAMAKIRAMARALKASGAPGSMDLLSAQVYIGLLLGTLPPIPPAEGAPPDDPPDGEPADDGESPGHGEHPGHGEPRGGQPPDRGKPPGGRHGSGSGRNGLGGPWPDHGDAAPWPDAPAVDVDDDLFLGSDEPCAGQEGPSDGSGQDDDWAGAGPEPVWPALAANIPPGLAAPGTTAPVSARPAGGLLDLSLPWTALAGLLPEPGWLGGLGPVTPVQACQLADLASRDPATEWRIILITPSGQARGVARIPRLRDGPRERSDTERSDTERSDTERTGGLVGRVTLTVPDTVLDRAPPDTAGNLGEILAAALRAASRAAARADAAEAADALADGCAHQAATDAYRPPASLRDKITARDLTCRFPTCRQPVWRCDLDHTLPWEAGGRTCGCNLGGLCRAHHKIKQHPFWTLRQDTPGIFRWTTPAGRTYTVTPDSHAA